MLQVDSEFVQEVPTAKKRPEIVDMSLYREKKKQSRVAEIISVKRADFVNPLGSTLSGVTKTNAPINLPGAVERWKVVFRFDDDTQFEGIVGMFKNISQYEDGTKGILTIKGGEILSWEPFRNGEESEAALLPQRERKRRLKTAAAVTAGVLVLAAAMWVILAYALRTPVSTVLESEDGRSVNMTVSADRRMTVNIQGTHFVVIRWKNAQYRVELPTMAEHEQELRRMQAEANNPESSVSWNAYLGERGITGNLFTIQSSDQKEVFCGTTVPANVPVKIVGTGKNANISLLISRLSFE